TALLKVGATDLLLRLLEARVRFPDLALAREMQAIRVVSHDLSGTETVELADGRERTAVDIQREILDLVASHVGGVIDPSDEVDRVLELWDRALRAVATGDPSLVDTELDWAIKLRLMRRYQERTGASLDDARIARLELAFHDVAPGRG